MPSRRYQHRDGKQIFKEDFSLGPLRPYLITVATR